MPRLQILELPTEHHGDDMTTPYLLVLDQVPRDDATFEAFRKDVQDPGLAERTGARAILCFEGTIEIPANEIPVDSDGHTINVKVEGDFEAFRGQVEQEIRAAQARIAQARLGQTV